VVTAHRGVDHEQIVREAPATVDLRGITRHLGIPTVDQL
jgi:hypothetical protein